MIEKLVGGGRPRAGQEAMKVGEAERVTRTFRLSKYTLRRLKMMYSVMDEGYLSDLVEAGVLTLYALYKSVGDDKFKELLRISKFDRSMFFNMVKSMIEGRVEGGENDGSSGED